MPEQTKWGTAPVTGTRAPAEVGLTVPHTMDSTRRAVFKQLAIKSGADPPRTTTVETLASAVGTDERVVGQHVEALAACELARTYPDGRVRVTVTAEQLLELDIDDSVVLDVREGE